MKNIYIINYGKEEEKSLTSSPPPANPQPSVKPEITPATPSVSPNKPEKR